MRTLWQRFVHGKVVQENEIYNALHSKIHDHFSIDEVGFRGEKFILKEILEVTRKIQGNEFKFVDYRLESLENMKVNLRIFPTETTNKDNYEIILLHKFDEMSYSQGLEEALNDVTGVFKITLDSGEVEEFKRLDDVFDGPQNASIKSLKDLNNNKSVEANEVVSGNLLIWDFYREVSKDNFEFLYADQDAKTGWPTLWRGFKVLNSQISAY